MADAVAFRAGGGRRKVQEVQKTKEEVTELARTLVRFGKAIDVLARRAHETPTIEEEDEAAAEKDIQGGEYTASTNVRWDEVVDHLDAMLGSDVAQVRAQAAITIASMARCVERTKALVCAVPEIIARLVKIMNEGQLEAISAIYHLTDGNETACDQARAAGAISILAGYVAVEGGDGNDGKKSEDDSNFAGSEKKGYKKAEVAAEKNNAARERIVLSGTHSLAELGGDLLDDAFVQLGAGMDERPNAEGAARPTVVPVAMKSEVVATLRCIATSNDINREAITREKRVIPQLVKLMTKMQDTDDGKSGTSGLSGGNKSDHSQESRGSDDSKNSRKKRQAEAAKAREMLALENRRLAEAAGQMLHMLILDGRPEVKRIIISAIISTVQQPGSVPPEEVPALMEILKSAAEEQLSLVQRGDNISALQAALEFGRWIKVPAIMLGEARNNFRAAQDARKRLRAKTRIAGEADVPIDEDAFIERETCSATGRFTSAAKSTRRRRKLKTFVPKDAVDAAEAYRVERLAAREEAQREAKARQAAIAAKHRARLDVAVAKARREMEEKAVKAREHRKAEAARKLEIRLQRAKASLNLSATQIPAARMRFLQRIEELETENVQKNTGSSSGTLGGKRGDMLMHIELHRDARLRGKQARSELEAYQELLRRKERAAPPPEETAKKTPVVLARALNHAVRVEPKKHHPEINDGHRTVARNIHMDMDMYVDVLVQ